MDIIRFVVMAAIIAEIMVDMFSEAKMLSANVSWLIESALFAKILFWVWTAFRICLKSRRYLSSCWAIAVQFFCMILKAG